MRRGHQKIDKHKEAEEIKMKLCAMGFICCSTTLGRGRRKGQGSGKYEMLGIFCVQERRLLSCTILQIKSRK